MAQTLAQRSKDPSTQHGAIIVDARHRIISSGFNGPPAAMADIAVPWERPAKYPYIIHAEDNALWFGAQARGVDGLCGATLYVTGRPCSRCTLLAVRAGIDLIVYGSQASVMCDDADWLLTLDIAKLGGLALRSVSCKFI